MSPVEGSLLFRSVPLVLRLNTADKTRLHFFMQELTARVTENKSFCCLITNDRALQRLNHNYLGHDYPTDVLAFPNGEGDQNLGDLAISIERAAAQAQQFGHTTIDEICILMLHGVLHLLGMDHETDRGKMARAERQWRKALGLPQTLIARTGS